MHEEPLVDDVIRRLLEGYRYVDQWLAERIDVFGYGKSRYLLELNHRVLCGVTPERRQQFRGHIAATERHFYDDANGGIGNVINWYQRHQTKPPRALAGALFVQVVSVPQLFLEGNSRTASLMAGYCARAGLPPLVVTSDLFTEYHQMVGRCLALRRAGIGGMLGMNLLSNRCTAFIEKSADPRFLELGAIDAAAR